MEAVRRLILALLAFGLVGTSVELVLMEHYEDSWQAAPLGVIAAGLAAVGWQSVRPTRGGLRVLRLVMVTFVLSGGVGVLLHFRGNLEFQVENDPNQTRSALFWKVMRAHAPPALAPGLMAQLGLLGLIYAYKHPASASAGERAPANSGG